MAIVEASRVNRQSLVVILIVHLILLQKESDGGDQVGDVNLSYTHHLDLIRHLRVCRIDKVIHEMPILELAF
jgi:hypothetical protein